MLHASAEDLPFESATFDVAVSTLVLCGVDDALPEAPPFARPAVIGTATSPA